MTNAPWFVRIEIIHNDLQIESKEDHIKKLSRKFFLQIAEHKYPLIISQIEYAYNNGKYLYPYSTMKWSPPLKTPELLDSQTDPLLATLQT
ncbi:hypothetical protein AVEN_120567-1 [Araneus ventricosus]|uniref:Uncharacterized protein n=1 Tax=Araneus ventricosus TaxID=182803 RepID=A0A4Y2H811_ARAVE|nr:hypothetical protein AVEN_120567-1 [Araneus ventricosus]